MRKLFLLFLIACPGLTLVSCNSSSPENYFNTAVLSCNTTHGFASAGLQRELQSPSVKMTDSDKNNFVPMKRNEVLDDKIQVITSNLTRLKQLKETTDTRELINASLTLYEYVLPVYENEYRELARLYDDEASAESIVSYTQLIHDKYYPGYIELMDKLIDAGKPFAEKHNIKVNWDVRTSPQ